VLSQTGYPKNWWLAGSSEYCSLVVVSVGAKCRILADLGSTYCLSGRSVAAFATFTGIRGMSHSGRLPPIRNPASARISVTGNGNSVPNQDIQTGSVFQNRG